MEHMEDQPPPTSVQEVIKLLAELGQGYPYFFPLELSGYSDTWQLENGEIHGPPSASPEDITNEQWVNQWMKSLHNDLGIQRIAPDAYYRIVYTGGKQEFDDACKREFKKSVNHRTDMEEAGKSVNFAPLWIYFKNCPAAFLMKGNPLPTTCSDGTLLLDLDDDLRPASHLMTIADLLTEYYEVNKKLFSKISTDSGVHEMDIFVLSLGIWFNYEPNKNFPVATN